MLLTTMMIFLLVVRGWRGVGRVDGEVEVDFRLLSAGLEVLLSLQSSTVIFARVRRFSERLAQRRRQRRDETERPLSGLSSLSSFRYLLYLS